MNDVEAEMWVGPGCNYITFGCEIVGLRSSGERCIVDLVDGTTSVVVYNRKRDRLIVPRRWRKPRNA